MPKASGKRCEICAYYSKNDPKKLRLFSGVPVSICKGSVLHGYIIGRIVSTYYVTVHKTRIPRIYREFFTNNSGISVHAFVEDVTVPNYLAHVKPTVRIRSAIGDWR